jgi:serine-type D-Ala-D-Ala carboxypeptidase/endopeptidase
MRQIRLPAQARSSTDSACVSTATVGSGIRSTTSAACPATDPTCLLIPEHDIGGFAFANRTYAPAALVVRQASARLYDTGALKAVHQRGSDAVRIEQAVAKIYASGSVTAEPQALAVNLLLDRSVAERDRELQALRAQLGECRTRSEMDVRHALSAVLRCACDRGTLTSTVLLAPVPEPSLQRLDFTASD